MNTLSTSWHRRRHGARVRIMVVAVAALALLAAIRRAYAAESMASPSYQVAVALKEVRAPSLLSAGSTTVLANPYVMVGANDEAKVHVGGTASVGHEKVPHGISLRVLVKPAAGNLVRVDGKLEISAANAPSTDFALVRGTCVHFSTLMPCGQTVRTTLNPNAEPSQILELRVDPAKPSAQAVSQAAASPAGK